KKFKRKLSAKYHPDLSGSNEDSAILNSKIDEFESGKMKPSDDRTLFTKVKEGVQDTKNAWKSDWKDRKATIQMGKNYIEVSDKQAFKEAIASLKHHLTQNYNLTKKLASFSLLQIIEAYENLEWSMGRVLNMLLSRERPIRVLLNKIDVDEQDIDTIFNKLHKAKGDVIKEEILNEFIPLALPLVLPIAAVASAIAIPIGVITAKTFSSLLKKVVVSQQEKKGLQPVYEKDKLVGFASKAKASLSNVTEKGEEVRNAIAKRTSEGFVSIKETLSPLGEFLKKTPEFINDHIPETIAVAGGAALIIALAKYFIKKRKIKKYPNIEKEAKKLNKKYQQFQEKK
ncbi:MAG: hypothetical protein LBF97_05645, partial [Elusimicrobiota bacterium]|nr:hypothetical protein [Elusimicrobiota bacterium]